ncbi:MAG: response regulator transcription factor [Ferruginibacter sp.]
MSLRTIIVEDEPLSRQYVINLVKQIPNVDLVAYAVTETEATDLINSLLPDLILMDIELHTGSGFEVLRTINSPGSAIIFTTALDHYAIKIIRLSGVPYLQKPIDSMELKEALRVVQKNYTENTFVKALAILKETLNNNNIPVQIAIAGNEGKSEYITMGEIVRIDAGVMGCVILLHNNRVKNSTYSIKELENLLEDFLFIRVNSTQLINVKEVEKGRGVDTIIKLKNGDLINVSHKKLQQVEVKLSLVQ